ncbi:recombinase family protein [uncultured Clostridium sp.]|jgi:DNA invertase Pin-like site-specific DNA recombinase|uniref:recombinase family protein n=1 Tax=uncultured Clostridium sp. TaxID=59620 RepID=UPI0026051940|nr:recombinase family protein [uncultured Clostridium sp.]
MLIGYARVSTEDQKLELQLDALREIGCEKVFTDVASGAYTERFGLTEVLSYLREEDILVVWKLDRLGRTLKQLIEIINQLSEKNIGFLSLHEKIDTTNSGGKLIFHIFAALAEFERDIIRERTKAGLKAARARGKLGGRPKIMDENKISIAKTLYNDGTTSVKDICKMLNISRATLYRYI